MADAGANPIYAAMNSPEGVGDELMGPSFSYADNVAGPSSMGIGSDGTFSQLGRNASGIAYYVKALITGDPPLGNQYYVNTGGTCQAKDGQLRARYNYINNLPSGSPSILPGAMKDLGADFNGLIPGVVDDIEGLDGDGVFLRESFGDRSRFHVEGEDDRAGAGRHLHVGFGDRTHVGRDLLERDFVGYDGTEDLSDGLE